MSVIVRELYGKRLGLLAMIVPVCRVALGIRVLSSIPWQWQVLFLIAIVALWGYFATKTEPEQRGDTIVSILLLAWAASVTFLTNF